MDVRLQLGVSSLVVKVSKFLEKAKNRPCKGLIVDQITFVRGSRTDQMQIALEDLLLQAKQDLISSFQTDDDLVCAKFFFVYFLLCVGSFHSCLGFSDFPSASITVKFDFPTHWPLATAQLAGPIEKSQVFASMF